MAGVEQGGRFYENGADTSNRPDAPGMTGSALDTVCAVNAVTMVEPPCVEGHECGIRFRGSLRVSSAHPSFECPLGIARTVHHRHMAN